MVYTKWFLLYLCIHLYSGTTRSSLSYILVQFYFPPPVLKGKTVSKNWFEFQLWSLSSTYACAQSFVIVSIGVKRRLTSYGVIGLSFSYRFEGRSVYVQASATCRVLSRTFCLPLEMAPHSDTRIAHFPERNNIFFSRPLPPFLLKHLQYNFISKTSSFW